VIDYITDWWLLQDKPCDYSYHPLSNTMIDNSKADIRMYPNPVNNRLTISSESGIKDEVTVIIYDTTGKLVIKKKEHIPCEINTGHLVSGLYYILIFDSKQCLTSNKFIKL
jgi:hypothetical protein